MAFFSNAAVNRLAVHSTLHQLAWTLSGGFFATFLLRAGLSPAGVLMATAAVLGLRFVLRPAVLVAVSVVGLRHTLMLGGVLHAGQILALAPVQGHGPALVLYVVCSAVGDVFYWTCYHAYFAALGDREERGAQVGARGLLATFAGAIGPGVGGLLLAHAGAWTAFGVGATIEFAAILPLLQIAEPTIGADNAGRAFRAAREGALLFSTDGFITCASVLMWDMVSFLAFDQRFDVLGGVMSAASLSGAAAGMILGRLIDAGHAGRAVGLNACLLAGVTMLKAAAAGSPLATVAASLVANAGVGLYMPTLMTTAYNEGKASPCPLRFHFATEGGWDAGGISACLIGALAWQAGLPPSITLLIALLGVAAQARLLRRRDDAHASAAAPAVAQQAIDSMQPMRS